MVGYLGVSCEMGLTVSKNMRRKYEITSKTHLTNGVVFLELVDLSIILYFYVLY